MKTKMLMIAAILLSACQQEMIPTNDPGSGVEILADAGSLHNQMIAYYYANRLVQDGFSETMLPELMKLSWEYLEEQGFNRSDLDESRELMEKQFRSSILKGVSTDNDYAIDTAGFVDQISGTGLYSKQFQAAVKKILVLAHKKDDREAVRKYVNRQFSKLKFSEENDQTGQQLFTSIFNASYDFWEQKDETQLKNAMLKRTSWIIINDGIGGILGMVFGPAGSIVTATVFSVGTNEEIDD